MDVDLFMIIYIYIKQKQKTKKTIPIFCGTWRLADYTHCRVVFVDKRACLALPLIVVGHRRVDNDWHNAIRRRRRRRGDIGSIGTSLLLQLR